MSVLYERPHGSWLVAVRWRWAAAQAGEIIALPFCSVASGRVRGPSVTCHCAHSLKTRTASRKSF